MLKRGSCLFSMRFCRASGVLPLYIARDGEEETVVRAVEEDGAEAGFAFLTVAFSVTCRVLAAEEGGTMAL